MAANLRYQYSPGRGATGAPELGAFITRARRALRAAHGLGLPLRFEWHSGLRGGAVLIVPPGPGARWMQFGLSSAYDLGQWSPADADPRVGVRRPYFHVHSTGPAELPFPAPFEELPWSESVLGELGGTRPGLCVEWELTPDATLSNRLEWLSSHNGRAGDDLRTLTTPERWLRDRQEARRTGPRWRVTGRICGTSRSSMRAASARIAHLLEAASHQDGGNGFRCAPAGSLLGRLRSDPILSEAELVGLLPPPVSSVLLARPPEAGAPIKLWLGRDLKGGSVGLPVLPGQGRHFLVLGETGMGKSSLVTRLAWQASRWGSVILLDPIGDTARSFLAGLSEVRRPQVTWISAARGDRTLSLLSEVAPGPEEAAARRDRVLGDVVAALRRVRSSQYAESTFWGPRLEEMLFQSIRAASRWPGASLAVAERLLSPEGWSGSGVPEAAREAVGDLRRRLERAPQDGDGARRLLSEITRNEALRQMLDAERPTWRVRDAVGPGRITIISGDAPQVGETAARYLLAVVLALLWNAVLSRAQSGKCFLVLDEAQWYAHDGVADMLRMGRRFDLHVGAVTQSLRSLPESVRDAVTTNSADIVLFRGDPMDARDVSRWAPGISPERVLRMARGEAAVLLDKGVGIRWIRLAKPLPTPGVVESLGTFPPGPGDARDGTSPADPGPVRAPETAPSVIVGPESTSILEWLRAAALETPGLEEVKVRHAELRNRWAADPSKAERLLREGGRILSSSGAILRKGRDSGGSYWVLSRPRLTDVLSERGPLLPAPVGGPRCPGRSAASGPDPTAAS